MRSDEAQGTKILPAEFLPRVAQIDYTRAEKNEGNRRF